MRALDPYRVARWVGGRVAERRRSIAWTQEEFAEQLEVSVKYVQRLEAGTQNLTIHSVVRLANLLEVTPAYLLRPPKTSAKRKPGRPKKRPSTTRARS